MKRHHAVSSVALATSLVTLLLHRRRHPSSRRVRADRAAAIRGVADATPRTVVVQQDAAGPAAGAASSRAASSLSEMPATHSWARSVAVVAIIALHTLLLAVLLLPRSEPASPLARLAGAWAAAAAAGCHLAQAAGAVWACTQAWGDDLMLRVRGLELLDVTLLAALLGSGVSTGAAASLYLQVGGRGAFSCEA